MDLRIVIFSSLSIIILSILLFLSIQQYIKTYHTGFLLLGILWFSIGIWSFAWLIHTFIPPTGPQRMLQYTFFAVTVSLLGFSIIILYDWFVRESLSSLKLLLWVVISILMIVLTFFDQNYYIALYDGHDYLYASPLLLGLINDSCIVLGLYVLYYHMRILQKVPQELKPAARILLIGSIFQGIFSPLSVIIYVIFENLPGIQLLLMAIGSVFCIIAFKKEPRLFYALAFNVERIMVIETKGGITLFNYSWKTDEKSGEEDLLGGMFQGISLFVKEALNKGALHELRMDHGILLIEQCNNPPIAVVLVVGKSSKALRDGIKIFMTQFLDTFKEELKRVNQVEGFKPANKIVEQIFQFVPRTAKIKNRIK